MGFKHGIVSNSPTGPHFKDPTLLVPYTVVSANLTFKNTAASNNAANTTAFFTGFAQHGIQDNTDWTANTYKTIYSHTGKGIVYGMVACAAGGAETTTFEITIDGVKSEITVTNANTERAMLLCMGASNTAEDEFSAAGGMDKETSALDSGTLTTYQTAAKVIPPPSALHKVGVGALMYEVSCLIRMKHSANVTNSTATAYSGVLVRKRIAA